MRGTPLISAPVFVFVIAAFGACVGSDPETLSTPGPDSGDSGNSTDGGGGGGADGASTADGGGTDSSLDGSASFGARAIATGAGYHPTAAVGTGAHTCAIAGPDKSIYCWGANDRGQLGINTTGDGATSADVSVATHVSTDENNNPLKAIDELALAPWHSCARQGDKLYCWGQRFSGAQLETPSSTNADRTRPKIVSGLVVQQVSAGGTHTCALLAAGTTSCFGHSYWGETGRFTGDTACDAPIFYAYQGIVSHSCNGTSGTLTSPVANTVRTASGEIHSCLVADGNVHCFGANENYQLGSGSTSSSLNTPVKVASDTQANALAGITHVASAGKHTCALRNDNHVLCWGLNNAGQVGLDPTGTSQRNYANDVLSDASSIGIGDGVSCAVKTDKSVWCWGANDSGQLGNGGGANQYQPVQVKGPGGTGTLGNVRAIAPGYQHNCALLDDGSVWCWGKNDRGQLGDNSKIDRTYPVRVQGLP